METTTKPCKNCGRHIVRFSEECWHCGALTWIGVLPTALLIALLCVVGAIGIAESRQYAGRLPASTMEMPE